MTQTMMFELEARDEAIDRVLANAGDGWRSDVLSVLLAMREREVTGEDIRLACEAENIRPHHHNAWGGMIAGLVREGYLRPTGKYQPMRAVGSHGRKTQVYERTRP